MDLLVAPLHHYKSLLHETCKLINDEWQRSESARLHSLEASSDSLPTNLILINTHQSTLIGHLKLSAIPSLLNNACFIESVVIAKHLRGQGFGTILMNRAEDYCRCFLHLQTIYLSTRGQEEFYAKLGYVECGPISIYGSFNHVAKEKSPKIEANNNVSKVVAPPPPPLPKKQIFNENRKTYMKKDL